MSLISGAIMSAGRELAEDGSEVAAMNSRKVAPIAAGSLILWLILVPVWAQENTAQPGENQPQATSTTSSQTGTKPSTTTSGTTTTSSTTSGQPGDASTPAAGDSSAPASGTSSTPSTGASSSSSSSSSSPSPNAKSQTGKSTDYVPQSANPDKETHNGNKNDIDAIGNRKIGSGNKGFGDWYSLESEIRMGKAYSQQLEASVKLVQDPVVNEYVNRIGQTLVRNSDAKVPFTIKVIDSDEINAMALPGGFFYVNSGLLLAADEEAEVAGVMAHEIAHVAARHATRGMTRNNLANLASIPLIFVGGGVGYAVRSAAGLGMPMTFLTFQRGFEAEADYLGLEYMYKRRLRSAGFHRLFREDRGQGEAEAGYAGKSILYPSADSRPHC